jgi:flagellar M-ring protein FliF
VQGFGEFLKTLGLARIAAMGAVTLALVGFFAFVIMRVTAPQMSVLFTDLTIEDSSAIVKDLERQGIEYTLKNDGSTILVPKENIGRLRMKLAEVGLPKGGGVGYEIFDRSDALGTTSFVQNVNRLRALEGELARTIRTLDRVQAARVHLVLPERPLFSREKIEPSASIVLKVRGTLETQQVRAIRHLIASAVNGLRPERVSIVDESGRLLADGAGREDAGGVSLGVDERKVAFERRVRDEIESIVSSVVGPGRARVHVTADFDFNRITQTSDKFDPEGRVVRSSQLREESSSSGEREDQVTVANELPGANQQRPPATENTTNTTNNNNGAREQSKKTEETVNYEISRTTKTEVIEGGRINRISVAVLVDGTYTRNDRGEAAYQERPKEELDRIAALVRSAIGFEQKRGDQVEVVNLRFAETAVPAASEPTGWLGMLQFTKDDIWRGLELAVLGLLSLIVFLFVLRPLLRRVLTAAPAQIADQSTALAVAPAAPELPAAEPIAPPSNHTAKMIDIAKVQGQVHAQSVQKVGELTDKNPEEAVAIIRQWLHESAA